MDYSDDFARGQLTLMEAHLKDLLQQCIGREYRLTNVGIKRDFNTGDVVLKLHLKTVSRILEIEGEE